MALGAGRNGNTLNSIYAGDRDGVIQEFRRNGSDWDQINMGGPGINDIACYGVAIGDGRNDGVIRVYGGFGNGTTYEYLWNGTSWSAASLGDTGGVLNGMALGMGRQSDGINSVFVSSDDNVIYEYVWFTETPTPSPSPTDTPVNSPTITPTPSITPTVTISPTSTITSTFTPSATITSTFTQTVTFTQTLTATISPTSTISPTNTYSPTITVTPTRTVTYTATPSPTITLTMTASPTMTVTQTSTASPTYTVSPTITQTSTPNLAAEDLSNVIVYPNPYRGDVNLRGEIILFNLPDRAMIRFYTVDGRKVKEIVKDDPGNRVVWNMTNENGADVASGVYIYIIKTIREERKGKVVILK